MYLRSVAPTLAYTDPFGVLLEIVKGKPVEDGAHFFALREADAKLQAFTC